MINFRFELLLLITIGFSCNLHAEKTVNLSDTETKKPLMLSGSIAYLQGKSQEFVYDADTGRTISQLNWEAEGTPILKGELSYDMVSSLTLSLGGWTTAGTSGALVNDYDWLNENRASWTHWSYHPRSQLRYANEFNANVTGWLWQKTTYRLGILTGFERSSVSYLTIGGCFNYDSGEILGCFPINEIGMGYQQTFYTGYLGVTGEYIWSKFKLRGTFKFGPSAQGADVDQHYQRNLTFKETGSGDGKYYYGSLLASYEVNHHFRMFIEGIYNKFTHQLADMITTDNETGDVDFSANSAGLSYKNFIISVGVTYRPVLN